jgi:hypothetical protein
LIFISCPNEEEQKQKYLPAVAQAGVTVGRQTEKARNPRTVSVRCFWPCAQGETRTLKDVIQRLLRPQRLPVSPPGPKLFLDLRILGFKNFQKTLLHPKITNSKILLY